MVRTDARLSPEAAEQLRNCVVDSPLLKLGWAVRASLRSANLRFSRDGVDGNTYLRANTYHNPKLRRCITYTV